VGADGFQAQGKGERVVVLLWVSGWAGGRGKLGLNRFVAQVGGVFVTVFMEVWCTVEG
jgi:hypothetical protein